MRAVSFMVPLILAGLAGVATSGAAFAAPKVHTVVIEQMKFSPETLQVTAGDTVIWKNKDIVPHNVMSSDGRLKSPTIAAGKSWKYKARGKGESPYLCTLHPMMKATLQVK